MPKMTSSLLILFLPSLVMADDSINNILANGIMRFRGLVIAESCRIEAGDRQMTVNLGHVSSNRFNSVGEDVNPTAFDIHLTDCTTAVSQRVAITFHGTADGKNPDIISIGEGPEIASDIGVALFDDDGNLIPLNGPERVWKSLYKGSTTLHLVAKYRMTGNHIRGGQANAQVWFSLTYQ